MKKPGKGGNITIYDIAKKAGVSPSTVSRVINNRPGVGAATRKRLQKLLKEYNYFPNEAARSLVNQTSRFIGILIDDIRTIHHTEGAYIIERQLVDLGYCCMIFNTGRDNESKARYIEIMRTRRVDGVVMMGSTFQNDEVAASINQHLSDVPVVMANGYLDLPNTYGILADEQNGVASCVELLYKKGKSKLAFVIDVYTPSNRLKQRGFEEACQRLGLQGEVYQCASTLAGAYEVTQQIMRERPATDGIIYVVDLLAASGVRALVDLGCAVPERVAVVGVDNSIYGEISNPKLTSLDNKLLDLSTAAADTLIAALQGRRVPKKVLIYSSIVERETT